MTGMTVAMTMLTRFADGRFMTNSSNLATKIVFVTVNISVTILASHTVLLSGNLNNCVLINLWPFCSF